MKSFFLSVVFASVLIPASLFSQGTLYGTVSDTSTGEKLVGVNVYLVGTSIGSATDIEGEYRIQRIPPGVFTIRYSYMGFEQKEREVNFLAGGAQKIDVQLTPSIILGEEVVVTAQMRGQMAAINQQLTSNTIVSVVSEEKIQELPDANAAAAIGRLSGVSLLRSGGEASQVVLRGLSSKFSTITIDGVRISPTGANDRGIDLSTISQGSLAGIELFKALMPDKDADAIAGSVNLVTRKAPSGRLMRVDVKGNYNGLEQSADQYNINGRYSERYLGDLLGLQLTANLEKTIRSNEATNYDYDQSLNNYSDYLISAFSVTYLDEIRKRRGGSILLDINTPDDGSIRFNTVFNQTSRDYITHNRNYHLSGGVTYTFRDRSSDINTLSSSLRGENYFMGFEADWNIAFSETKVKTPYDYQMDFTEASSTAGGDSSGMRNVPPEYSKGPVEKWIPYAFNNFRLAVIDRATDRSSSNYDKERTAYLNVGRKYVLNENITGEFKFGGKYRAKSRSRKNNEHIATYYLWGVPQYYRLPDGSFGIKDYSDTRFDGLIGKLGVPLTYFLDPTPLDRGIYDMYRLYPLINRYDLRLWRAFNINGFHDTQTVEFDTNGEYQDNRLIAADGYGITESVLAGYLMNTLHVGRFFTLMTGVRVENDNNDYLGTYTPLALAGFIWPQTGYIYDKEVSYKETTVLPNVQTIIKPTDFMNLRIAAYKALARPDFNHRLPRFIVRSASGNTIEMGNRDLKNAVAWNYEVQTQFFGDNIGLFSVAAFYKDVKNMYHSINSIPLFSDTVDIYGERVARREIVEKLGVDWRLYTNTFPFATQEFTLTWPYNSSRPTRVWGFEVEHQTDLRFLPGPLKNIVLNYNFTVVRSETWITTAGTLEIPNPPRPPRVIRSIFEKKQKLEDQPEFFANASVGYDYDDFSIRLSLFYQGAYNRSFSSDQRGDGITDSYTRWDIAVKQRITDQLSVLVNLHNITDAQEGTSIANRLTGWTLADASNKYGMAADLGVRLEF